MSRTPRSSGWATPAYIATPILVLRGSRHISNIFIKLLKVAHKDMNSSSPTPAPGPRRVAWARQKAAAESRRRTARLREEGRKSTPAPAEQGAAPQASAPACGPQRVAWARQEAAAQGRRSAVTLRQKGKTSTPAPPPAPEHSASAVPGSGPQRVAWARHKAALLERRGVAVWVREDEASRSRHMPRAVSGATVPLQARRRPSKQTLAPLQEDVATEVTPHATVLQDAYVSAAASGWKTPSAQQRRRLPKRTVLKGTARTAEHTDSSQSADAPASVKGVDVKLPRPMPRKTLPRLCHPLDSHSFTWGVNERKKSLKCPVYLVVFHRCDHCRSLMTEDEVYRLRLELLALRKERRARRRQRVKELNAALQEEQRLQRRQAQLGEARDKSAQPGTPPRARAIKFDLRDVPKPIKDREFLYRDYQRCRKGMLEQWRRRLHQLGCDEAAWREELQALAASRGWRGEGMGPYC